MADPVVSYRYGKRPIIDVPAFVLPNYAEHRTVPSLQSSYYDLPPGPPMPPQTVEFIPPPADNTIYPRPYHTAPPPDPFHYNKYDPYSTSRNLYYGPQGEIVKPIQQYFDPHSHPHHPYPGIVHGPPHPPPPPPPPPPYPLPPPNPHYHIHPPPTYTRGPPQEFDINCDLEYGRVVKISVRESKGHFRGIPEYLRKELVKCYGRYPFMSVKIKFHDGDFHIFADHDKNRMRRERDHHRGARDEYDRDMDYERRSRSGTYTEALPPRQMDRAPRDSYRDMDKDDGWDSYR